MREKPIEEYFLVTMERYSQEYSQGRLTYYRFQSRETATEYVKGQLKTGAFVYGRIEHVQLCTQIRWDEVR